MGAVGKGLFVHTERPVVCSGAGEEGRWVWVGGAGRELLVHNERPVVCGGVGEEGRRGVDGVQGGRWILNARPA